MAGELGQQQQTSRPSLGLVEGVVPHRCPSLCRCPRALCHHLSHHRSIRCGCYALKAGVSLCLAEVEFESVKRP